MLISANLFIPLHKPYSFNLVSMDIFPSWPTPHLQWLPAPPVGPTHGFKKKWPKESQPIQLKIYINICTNEREINDKVVWDQINPLYLIS